MCSILASSVGVYLISSSRGGSLLIIVVGGVGVVNSL